MNSWLLFLLKSTLSLSLLYLAFSVLMRKETFFKLNRITLLFIVIISAIIPFLYLPQPIQPIVQARLEPIFTSNTIVEEPIQQPEIPVTIQSSVPVSETKPPITIPVRTILLFVYLSGVFISFLILIYSIISVLLLFRKARRTDQNGIRLMIVDEDIPAFSFGRYILISQHDFDTNSEAIITHEQSHIRLGHFYDLILMELVKIIYWFNPLVYRMVRDLKEIQEFQADDHTISSGIDATKYQLLIIQKGVGHQKFALANSFNHCQIKNRITMMNKQKTSKAWRWKVATFLPLLALLLMAFGKTGEKVNPVNEISPQIAAIVSQDSVKKMNSTDFTPPPIFIEIQKEGILVEGELMTLDEFRKRMPLLVKHNPRSKFIVSSASINDSNIRAVKDILNETGASNIQFTVKYTPPPPTTVRENQNDTSSRLIEIRKDGNYIDNKLCSPDEIVKKAQAWKKINNKKIHLLVDESIPYVRVDEVREALENAKVYGITQSAPNSDDIIYFMGDVTEMAKFTQGKWNDWMISQFDHLFEGEYKSLEFKIAYSFIIDKNGKVRDGHITKACEYPEINAAFEKILAKIPDWEPAKRSGKRVSVYNRVLNIHKVYNKPQY